MKHLLLAAAALIAAPSFAQTTPAADPGTPAQQTAPATDPAAQPTPPAGAPAGAPTSAGGYQPTGNGLSGAVQPGAPVIFKRAPTPAEAYPAPAPMAKYPICKKGQFDQCMQRGGK